MDSKEIKEIKDLMKFIAQSDFAEFELEREGFKLRLVKASAKGPAVHGNSSGAATAPLPASAAAPSALSPPPGAHAPATVEPAAPVAAVGSDIVQVTSPMVGTFYRASNPSAPPFAQEGDFVKKGQVICIIEAMKLMNEIESEVSGQVVEIPVSNGQPVEYGEVLFRIRAAPS